jgi:hypothetical protein
LVRAQEPGAEAEQHHCIVDVVVVESLRVWLHCCSLSVLRMDYEFSMMLKKKKVYLTETD